MNRSLPPNALQSRTVVVAGDPEVYAQLLELGAREGFQTIAASDGVQTLKLLQQGKVDLALIDLLLPAMNGLEILRETRKLKVEIPIILFTNFPSVGPAVDAMKQGAADYLLKPLQGAEVLRALEGALQSRNSRKACGHAERDGLALQAQKMETLGRLAGSVAHDLSNQMTIVLGYSHLLLEKLEVASRIPEGLQEIAGAANRSAALTRQLLDWGRKEEPVPRPLDLNALVAGLEKMLGRLVGEGIELVTQLDPTLEPVQADPAQMEQIILNLALNARDAMPQGGVLTILTANESSKLQNGASRSAPLIPSVLLAVRDAGTGMNGATQSHLFEPFFTTKAAGHGTGLGLTIVKEIVDQLAGHIRADSIPGKGSTFTIALPPARDVDEPSTSEEAEPNTSCAGCETVLLVEDDVAVRSIVRRLLDRYGYTVLEARDANDAVHVAEQREGKIDLLLTDVVLPGIDGPTLAQRMHERYPDLKMLYVSGYPLETLARHGCSEGSIHLQKPFTADQLARMVRARLDQEGGRQLADLGQCGDAR
jgi:two-component system cell cycle sensor histidine kinase/response regulator CckA